MNHAARSYGARRTVALAVALLALAGCGLSGPAYAPEPGDAAVVKMTVWLSFDPGSVTIRTGETVEWRNVSPFTHTVTFDPAVASDPGDAEVPAGARSFDSGPIEAGGVFRHTFAQAGSYRYFCKPHEGHGMVGAVIVEP